MFRLRLTTDFLFLILLLSILFINISCSSHKKVIKDNKREYKYFRISANADDDQVFIRLQDDLGIDPKMEVYTIVIDIRDKTLDPYILFGDVNESNPIRFSWSRLSKDVQQGLVNWTGSNKESLE
jgi:hypothetical protein